MPAFPIAVTVIFAVAYIALDVNALHALRANQNTGLYLQSVVNLVHGGSTFDQPDGKPHMLVHNQWLVYVVLVPLVALWPRPETTIVVGVLALAAAAIPLYFFTRDCGADARVATLIAVAFLISPSVQGWAYDGFVGEDLIPIAAFSLALAIRRRALLPALACAELLLGIKEDEVWFVAWFGLLVALGFFRARQHRENDIARADRRLGYALSGLAAINGVAYYAIAARFGFVPEHPRYGLADPNWFGQATFVLEMLVPLAFAPLRLRFRLLAAMPLAAEVFLAQDRSYPLYHIGSYYTVPLVVCAVLATAYVAARQRAIAGYAVVGACVMAAFFNNASVLHLGRHPFSADPQYPIARAWAATGEKVDFPCEDVGAWTVASPNPNARLVGCGASSHRAPRPAWHDVPLGATAIWTRGPQTSRDR